MSYFFLAHRQKLEELKEEATHLAQEAAAVESEIDRFEAFLACRTVVLSVSGHIDDVNGALIPYEEHAAIIAKSSPMGKSTDIALVPNIGPMMELHPKSEAVPVRELLSGLSEVLKHIADSTRDGMISGYLVLRPELIRGVQDGTLTFVPFEDGVLTTVRTSSGQFAGSAAFVARTENARIWIPSLMQLTAAVTRQYYLTRIDRRLVELAQGIHEVHQRFEHEQIAKLLESCRTVKRELDRTKPAGTVCERELRALREISSQLLLRINANKGTFPDLRQQLGLLMQALQARYIAAELLCVYGEVEDDAGRAGDEMRFIEEHLVGARRALSNRVAVLQAGIDERRKNLS